VVYGTSSLLFLSLFFKDGIKSFFVWTVIRAMVIVLLMEDAVPFFSHDGLGPCCDLCLCRHLFRLCGRPLGSNAIDWAG
jgi:hypothetical protein